MPKLPPLKPRVVFQLLNDLGFELIRQKGSHCRFRHPDGRATTVPNHPSKDVSPLLLRRILKEIDESVETFLGGL